MECHSSRTFGKLVSTQFNSSTPGEGGGGWEVGDRDSKRERESVYT